MWKRSMKNGVIKKIEEKYINLAIHNLCSVYWSFLYRLQLNLSSWCFITCEGQELKKYNMV